MSGDRANQALSKGHRERRPVVPIDQLGSLIRQKRRSKRLTLAEAAQESGISPATLSRLERRASSSDLPTPDVRTLGAVTDWLGVSISGAGFAPESPTTSRMVPEASSVPNAVEAHLRADRNLDSATAALLARMFRAAYAEVTEKNAKGMGQSPDASAIDEVNEERE